ncbi:helix-turn-helix transcriptional regulator [Hyphomicrobium sulfonivorans]|uniref:helix-turn-helix transcriptional regulator n=1 Tax=Hyphomicrobium sulfonivorans TaxID=121290 RepID=UPI00156EAFE4|nr:helix-turn-helix transcriptional regulator [Hyphomicrobium sulfonivorans]MBI1648514.1 helix-turn-helix transcriptional regulator [Hyphomicrobium sulfonivorans]
MARTTNSARSSRRRPAASAASDGPPTAAASAPALHEAPQRSYEPHEAATDSTPRSEIENAAGEQARRFGAMVRERREALRMRQDDLALATGVGRRFILELEAGKASCQLGRSLVVAAAVGLRPFDLMGVIADDETPFLPDDIDDLPEP